MKIAILTLGTRGDVQPYVALGLGLRQAGFSVTIGTSRDFESFVTERGLRFVPFRFSVRETIDSAEGRAAFESKRAAFRLYKKVAPLMTGLLDDAWSAAQGAQAILFHPKIINAVDIAEKLKLPAMLAFYMPALSPTRAFPAPFIPGPATWGGFLNKASHNVFLAIMTAPYHRMLNRWRTNAGLPLAPFRGAARRRYGAIPKVYGYSRHLVPVPPDWGDSAHVTGQWFLHDQQDWRPSSELENFLSLGPPPVCVGFGSIAGTDPGRTTGIVVEALRLAGQRGILVGGWGGLQPAMLPPTILYIESGPYHWLFPRSTAVVHHGGAGSTGEALHAGKPAVVCPFFGDQPFWARRVYAIGAGPAPISQKRLSAPRLAEALQMAVTDEGMRRRAAVIGEQVRAEDGVQQAVQVIGQELLTQISRG